MADSPRRRYSPSPSPRRMRSRTRSRSPIRQRRGNEEAENPGNTLYVTGLSTRVTEKDLEDHFSREGKVIDCRLVVEPRTRISRGFGFVTMDNLEDADRCIKYLNQSILEGRFITVEKSRRKRPRTPTPGNYLGVKSTREVGSYHGRDRRRGYYDRGDGFNSRRSPRPSPYREGRMYSPRRSPFRGGGSRRDRSRTPPYSPPYESPVRTRGAYRSYSDRSR